ncbi:MAG: TIGR01212 family radical SAM protein [Desulfobacterium sp.]|nr:TIGR01212 family radical SAM protein [Desulfobacterium sp.]
MTKRYNDFNTYLKNEFGERVQKITVDAGFSCPNRDGTLSSGGCIYCNPKGSGTGAYEKKISITDQLLQGKNALNRRYKANKFFAYFQSFTNTYAPIEQLKAVYEEALAVKDIIGLSIGTRPDCVDNTILSVLEQYARKYLIWIEYGLQSVHNKTLDIINRGHDFQSFQNAVQITQGRNIKICVHVILGLPGEDRRQMLETAEILSEMKIDGIKLHLLYVIKGTRMEQLYWAGEYQCLEQQEYVDLICDFLERTPWNIVIQRLTSDPHRDELVAPEWSLKKAETLKMIQDELEKRNTRQGQLFLPDPTIRQPSF